MPFKITLAGTSRTFSVNDDETILDAALRQDIDLPYSCYSGICTTCKATCLKGDYDYGDFEIYGIDLNNNPNNELLLCSAFAKSDMTIHHPELSPEDTQSPYTQQYHIIERSALNNHVQRILLEPVKGDGIAYWPGQYLVIEYEGDSFPFSIANTPQRDGNRNVIELHLLDAPYNPIGEKLKAALFNHDTVTIQGPLGQAYLREDNEDPILFVAGGSGFAAIKPMLEYCLQHNTEREMTLYWGARHSDYLYYDKALKQWATTHDNFTYIPVISGEDTDWQGRTGLVHEAALNDHSDLKPYYCYLAGPFEMAFATRDRFIQRGALPQQIFSDAFQ